MANLWNLDNEMLILDNKKGIPVIKNEMKMLNADK